MSSSSASDSSGLAACQYASTGADGVKVWKFPLNSSSSSFSSSDTSSHQCAFHFHKHCLVDSVQWNHNSTALICGARDAILSIYQFHPFGLAFTLPASSSPPPSDSSSLSATLSNSSISALARSDGSRYLFTGNRGGVISCWDAQSKQITKKYIPTSQSSSQLSSTKSSSASIAISSIDWTANHFFTGTENGLFSVFSSKSGTQQLYGQKFQSSIREVGLSRWNSQSLLIAEESGAIHFYDWNAMSSSASSSVSFRPEHDAPLTCAKFFPTTSQLPSSSSLVLSTGLDCRIVLYDLNSKSAIHQFRIDSGILSSDIHYHGNLIILGGIDGSISLMDMRQTGKPMYFLKKAHSVGPVRAVKFTGLRPDKSANAASSSTTATTIPPPLSSTDSPKATIRTSSLTSRASATTNRHFPQHNGPLTASAMKDGIPREPFNFSTVINNNAQPSHTAAAPISPVHTDGQDNLLEISFISPIQSADNRTAARTNASSLRGSALFSAAGNETATKPALRNGQTARAAGMSENATNGTSLNPTSSAVDAASSALLRASLSSALPVQPNRSVTAVLANLLGQQPPSSSATPASSSAVSANSSSSLSNTNSSVPTAHSKPFAVNPLAQTLATASQGNTGDSNSTTIAADSNAASLVQSSSIAAAAAGSSSSSLALQSLQSRLPFLSEEQLSALRSFISSEVSASTESMRECVIQLQLDMLRSFHELQLTVQSSLQTHQQAMEDMLKEVRALRDDYLQIRHNY